jgi:hypothetical protein
MREMLFINFQLVWTVKNNLLVFLIGQKYFALNWMIRIKMRLFTNLFEIQEEIHSMDGINAEIDLNSMVNEI